MARQIGIMPIEGTIQNLTFYRRGGEYLVKAKSSIPRSAILNNSNFQRTRENMAEFGDSAHAGDYIRQAMHGEYSFTKDIRMISRLVKSCKQSLNLDVVNARGLRTVNQGITDSNAVCPIATFNFNKKNSLDTTLLVPFSVDPNTGIFLASNVNPANDLRAPANATHFTLSQTFAQVDLTTGAITNSITASSNVALNAAPANLTVTTFAAHTPGSIDIIVSSIRFFEMINLVQYALKDLSYDCSDVTMLKKA